MADDVEFIDLDPLITAAEEIADVLEKRYREQKSKAWERWCQSSLASGGKQVIRWITAPERGPRTKHQDTNLRASEKNGMVFGA